MRYTEDEYQALITKRAIGAARDPMQAEAERQRRRESVADDDAPSESESLIQQRGVAQARLMLQQRGFEQRLLFSIPNGGHLTDANRMRMVSEGMTAGVPDLFLAIPAGDFGGLWIEVKKPGGKVRKVQSEMRIFLEDRGYAWVLCYGVEEIVRAVLDYLNLSSGIDNSGRVNT